MSQKLTGYREILDVFKVSYDDKEISIYGQESSESIASWLLSHGLDKVTIERTHDETA